MQCLKSIVAFLGILAILVIEVAAERESESGTCRKREPEPLSACPKCGCSDDPNPICGTIKSHSPSRFSLPLKLYNFTNECELVCLSKCELASARFLYCGPCDERQFRLDGLPSDLGSMDCLRFKAKWKLMSMNVLQKGDDDDSKAEEGFCVKNSKRGRSMWDRKLNDLKEPGYRVGSILSYVPILVRESAEKRARQRLRGSTDQVEL